MISLIPFPLIIFSPLNLIISITVVNILAQKKKVVQLKNANISQKTYRGIVDMHIFFKAYPFSNLLVGETFQNIM